MLTEAITKDPLWKRILLFVGGIASTHGFGFVFDYVIYPVVTYRYGVLKSMVLLFLAACILNWLMVLIYDLFDKDLFGFDEIKRVKAGSEATLDHKWLRRIVRWGDVPAFIALSFYDPFLATLYRRDLDSKGMKKRDYFVLVVSTAIGCIVWSGLWSPITLLKK